MSTTISIPVLQLARAGEDLRDQLDRFAAWVAERLDEGDDDAAWAVTVAMERAAGSHTAADARPASPLIGRRFAAAHGRLLAQRGPATDLTDALDRATA